MRILIVGGTGLTGRAMAARFDRAGHELFLISRTGGDTPGRHLRVDRDDADAFQATLEQVAPDVVIDQIAYRGDHVDAVAAHTPARHLVCSSAAVLGSGLDLDEDAPTAAAANEFLAGKLGAERQAKEHGAIVLRPAYLYGPGHPPLTLHGRNARLISQMRAGQAVDLPGEGALQLQPVLAADYAAAVEAILHLDRPAPLYHIGGPSTTWRGWYESLAAAAGVALQVSSVSPDDLKARSPWYRDFLRHPLTITSKRLPATQWTALTAGAAALVDWIDRA